MLPVHNYAVILETNIINSMLIDYSAVLIALRDG